jgi:hypothetical protein
LKKCSLVLKEHIENRTEVQVRWNAVNIVEQEGRDDTSIVNDKKKKVCCYIVHSLYLREQKLSTC